MIVPPENDYAASLAGNILRIKHAGLPKLIHSDGIQYALRHSARLDLRQKPSLTSANGPKEKVAI